MTAENFGEEYFTRRYYRRKEGYKEINWRFILEIFREYGCKHVLDVGCAYGFSVKQGLAMGLDMYGIDVSEYAVKQAEKLGLKDRVNQGNICQLPFKDEFFDGVMCWHVLEHIRDFHKALDEINRILKMEGIFCVALPPITYIDFHLEPTHVAGYTSSQWKQFFRQHGFKVKRFPVRVRGKILRHIPFEMLIIPRTLARCRYLKREAAG